MLLEMRDLLLATCFSALALPSLGCAGARSAEPPRATGTGGSPGPMGAGGSAGTVGSTDYVPDVPVDYDGRYLDGSFEQNQGFGWDTCHTRTPTRISVPETGASDGSRFVMFDSVGPPTPWSPTNPSASQLYMWFSAPPSATAATGVYFDAKNVGGAGGVVTGVLRLYGTNAVCERESALAEIELDRLQLMPDWTTRCATITGLGAHAGIGLAMSGDTYQIGIDAFRLGPPCHASR
jgi:hypothetical protein